MACYALDLTPAGRNLSLTHQVCLGTLLEQLGQPPCQQLRRVSAASGC